MEDYRVELRSNAAPFVSDTSAVYVTADDGMAALREAVDGYTHPAGLYAAGAMDSKGKMVARYLSSRAATSEAAKCGLVQWRDDGLYVNDEKQPMRDEVWEVTP